MKSVTVENAISTLIFADSKNLTLLKEEALNYIGQNFAQVTAAKEMLNMKSIGIDKLDVELFQLIMELAANRIN